jgi:hypothetical protein
MQRIFVTGGTGFVGRNVVRALASRGFLERCLVRPGTESDLKGFESIDRVPGDVLQPDGLVSCAEGCAAIVNLVGIIREHRARGVTFERLHVRATENMLAVAKAAGVKALRADEALGTRRTPAPPITGRSGRPRRPSARAIIDWTIFRPSIIFGRETSSSPSWRPWSAAIRWCLCSAMGTTASAHRRGAGRRGVRQALRNTLSVGRPTTWPAPSPTGGGDPRPDRPALGRARVRKIHVPLGG